MTFRSQRSAAGSAPRRSSVVEQPPVRRRSSISAPLSAALVGASVVAALAAGCAHKPNVGTDALPLRRVVVYRNGVAYYERAGEVKKEEVTFRMRQRMVGDFLATLAIMERGGSTVRSASFPLDVDLDEPPPPPPELYRPYDPAVGPIAPPPPGPDPHDPNRLRDVVIRLDGKRHDLAVGYIAETPVWKPSYRLVVRENGEADLQAWGIVQNVSGEDWKGIELVLVAGAPLSFQSTLGEPVVPFRPIVSDGGEIIASMPEGTTTYRAIAPAPAAADAPASEMAEEDGYGYSFGGDEEAAMKSAEGSASGYGRAAGGLGMADAMGPMPAAPPPMEAYPGAVPSQPSDLSQLAGVSVRGGTTRYAMPYPVTVPDDSATMVLLANRTVPGEAVFLYKPDWGVPDSQVHPFRVVRFTNATAGLLERGPIAVFDEGAFLGQGLVEALPPDGKATVPFAVERALAVSQYVESRTEGAKLDSVSSRQLFIEQRSLSETTWTITNGSDEDARILVRHERRYGTDLESPKEGVEKVPDEDAVLITVQAKAAAETRQVVVEVAEERIAVDWLDGMAETAVRAFLAAPTGDAAEVEKLRKAWEIRNELRKTADAITSAEREEAELAKAARETRLSLAAIEGNKQAGDLRTTLTKRLTELTTDQERVSKTLIEQRLRRSELEIRFRDALDTISLRVPDDAPKP